MAELSTVEEFLSFHRNRAIDWHIILNNHASTRPMDQGGPIVFATSHCKRFTKDDRGLWTCFLDMPHSFRAGDDIELKAIAKSAEKKEAGQLVCRQALALLLRGDASKVRLLPNHWWPSPQWLIDNLPGKVGLGHQALPVHLRVSLPEAGSQAARLSQEQVEQEVTRILEHVLQTHGGEFDPSNIRHSLTGRHPSEQRLYSRLNGFLLSGQLRSFVERHPAFEWRKRDHHKNDQGMIIFRSTIAGPSVQGVTPNGASPYPAIEWPLSSGMASGSADAQPAFDGIASWNHDVDLESLD